MDFTLLKNYPGVKAEVRRRLDELHEQVGFSNDDDTVMILVQNIWKVYEKIGAQAITLTFQLYISPWKMFGVCGIVATSETVEKAAVVSYDQELADAVCMSKEEQREVMQKNWSLTTTREMMHKILEAIIQKADPSHDAETLQIVLENIDVLPSEGQYFAQMLPGYLEPDKTVVCWFIQRFNTDDPHEMVKSEIVEAARLDDVPKSRYHLIENACGAVLQMICNVNKALEANT